MMPLWRWSSPSEQACYKQWRIRSWKRLYSFWLKRYGWKGSKLKKAEDQVLTVALVKKGKSLNYFSCGSHRRNWWSLTSRSEISSFKKRLLSNEDNDRCGCIKLAWRRVQKFAYPLAQKKSVPRSKIRMVIWDFFFGDQIESSSTLEFGSKTFWIELQNSTSKLWHLEKVWDTYWSWLVVEKETRMDSLNREQ